MTYGNSMITTALRNNVIDTMFITYIPVAAADTIILVGWTH